MYARALLDGLAQGNPRDTTLRAKLDRLTLEQLREELLRADPVAAERIHLNTSVAACGRGVPHDWEAAFGRRDAVVGGERGRAVAAAATDALWWA